MLETTGSYSHTTTHEDQHPIHISLPTLNEPSIVSFCLSDIDIPKFGASAFFLGVRIFTCQCYHQLCDTNHLEFESYSSQVFRFGRIVFQHRPVPVKCSSLPVELCTSSMRSHTSHFSVTPTTRRITRVDVHMPAEKSPNLGPQSISTREIYAGR